MASKLTGGVKGLSKPLNAITVPIILGHTAARLPAQTWWMSTMWPLHDTFIATLSWPAAFTRSLIPLPWSCVIEVSRWKYEYQHSEYATALCFSSTHYFLNAASCPLLNVPIPRFYLPSSSLSTV